jgi:hypothetical protein
MLKLTDVVDAYKVWEGCWFLIGDNGNHVALLKKEGHIEIEQYDGSLKEYVEETESNMPTVKSGAGYVSDVFRKYKLVLNTSKQKKTI